MTSEAINPLPQGIHWVTVSRFLLFSSPSKAHSRVPRKGNFHSPSGKELGVQHTQVSTSILKMALTLFFDFVRMKHQFMILFTRAMHGIKTDTESISLGPSWKSPEIILTYTFSYTVSHRT